MKIIKFSSSSLVAASLVSSSFAFAAQNNSTLETGVIPQNMPAGTVITFDKDNNPVITKEGSINGSYYYNR